MRKQKNKILNFVFSCLPGAGHMYLGFMKLGVSLMILFFGIIGLAGWMNFDMLLFILPVLWFYSFFDSLNKYSLSSDDFNKLEDEFIWGKDIEFNFINKRSVRSFFSFLLIVIGLVMLVNNVWSILAFYVNTELYWLIEYAINRSYQIIFAIVIIILGIKLITGKKKEIAERTETDSADTKKAVVVNTAESFPEMNADVGNDEKEES